MNGWLTRSNATNTRKYHFTSVISITPPTIMAAPRTILSLKRRCLDTTETIS